MAELSFSSDEAYLLNLSATGLSKRGIARQLGVNENKVTRSFRGIRAKADGQYGTIYEAGLATGDISDEAVLESCNPSGFTHLSAGEKKVALRLRDGLSNKAIAEELVLTEDTVDSHLVSIYKKAETLSRDHTIAAMLAFSSPETEWEEAEPEPVSPKPSTKEREVLNFFVKGYKFREIGEELQISPETVHSRLFHLRERMVSKKPQLRTTKAMIEWGLDDGFIDADAIIETVNLKVFSSLTRTDRRLLFCIRDEQTPLQIAKSTFYSKNTVKSKLSELYKKVGVRGKSHLMAVMLALEYKQKQKLKDASRNTADTSS